MNAIRLFMLTSIFLLNACVTIAPVEKVDNDNLRCQLSTKKLSLKAISHRVGFSCGGSECLVALGVSALYTASTAVISGSIVLIGNTVHWLEKQGSCDDGLLNISVKNHNQPLLQQQGEVIILDGD